MSMPWPDEWFPPGEQGFPMPDWNAIAERVEAGNPPESWHRIYCELATSWMEKIHKLLGGRYTIRESRNFILLSTVTADKAVEVLASSSGSTSGSNRRFPRCCRKHSTGNAR